MFTSSLRQSRKCVQYDRNARFVQGQGKLDREGGGNAFAAAVSSQNRREHFFENTCRGDRRLKLDDRAYKVFFNAAACDTLKGDEERDFFRFLSGEKADSVFSKSIEEKVAFAKRNMEWRRQYMTWQQTIDEAKEISFEEGARQTARETARNFLREGDAPEKVARCCSLPLTEVLSLQAVLSREIGAR